MHRSSSFKTGFLCQTHPCRAEQQLQILHGLPVHRPFSLQTRRFALEAAAVLLGCKTAQLSSAAAAAVSSMNSQVSEQLYLGQAWIHMQSAMLVCCSCRDCTAKTQSVHTGRDATDAAALELVCVRPWPVLSLAGSSWISQWIRVTACVCTCLSCLAWFSTARTVSSGTKPYPHTRSWPRTVLTPASTDRPDSCRSTAAAAGSVPSRAETSPLLDATGPLCVLPWVGCTILY